MTTTDDDDDVMIDITPNSSPGGDNNYNTYSRGSTADNSDMERDREREGYNNQNQPQQSINSQQHQRFHQHVPTHSAFGETAEGKDCILFVGCVINITLQQFSRELKYGLAIHRNLGTVNI